MTDTAERTPLPSSDPGLDGDGTEQPAAAGATPTGPVAAGGTPHDVAAPRRSDRRAAGRVLRWTALAAAVGTVVALDTGVVPLPWSTPVVTARPAAGTDPSSPSGPDAVAAAEAREEGIRSTVDALEAALAARDEAALAALVDPAAPGTAERLRRMLRNLAVLPDAEVGVHWGTTWRLDRRAGSSDPLQGVVADVRLSVRIPAYEAAAGSTVEDLGLRAVDGRWLVTSWEQPTGTNLWPAERTAPWEADVDLAVVEKPHVLVIGAAGNGRANERLASRLEAAAVDVRKVWTTDRWNGRVVVVALDDEEFLDGWFTPGEAVRGGDESDHLWSFGLPDENEEYDFSRPHAVRTVVAADYLDAGDVWLRWAARELVSRAAFESLESERIPSWLYQGGGVYVASRPSYGRDVAESVERWGFAPRTRDRIRAGTWEPTLVTAHESFADGGKADAAQDWDSAFLATLYVADRHGERTLQRLVVRSSESGFDLAVEDVLGVDAQRFAADVARYARSVPLGAG